MNSKQFNQDERDALKRNYEKKFNTKEYLDSGYLPGDHREDYVKFLTSALHRIFSIEIEGGDSLLELGSGPTVHACISASAHYKTIVSSEFLEVNRKEVTKWLQRDPDAYDFSYVFQLTAKLENETDPKKLEARVRQHIKEVIPCDVLAPNPIAPLRMTFDAVISCVCYESATSDFASYKQAFVNTAPLIKPGGHLIQAGFFNCDGYFAGSTKLSSFPVTKQQVDEALSEAGFEVLLWMIQPRIEDGFKEEFTDSYVVVSKKLIDN